MILIVIKIMNLVYSEMKSKLELQKLFLASKTNNIFRFLEIPVEIDTSALFNTCEEELFLTLWDATVFAIEKNNNSQLYKMWMEKIEVFTDDI
jgi:hypothetical protein